MGNQKKIRLLVAAFLVVIVPAFFLTSCGSGGGSDGGSSSSTSATVSHRAGQDCLQSGCHTSGEKNFSYAGTVYSTAAGLTIANGDTLVNQSTASGIAVVITDSSGTVSVTTDAGGNFYTRKGNPGGGYNATLQGNTIGMVTRPTTGSCTNSSCHGGVTALIYTN